MAEVLGSIPGGSSAESAPADTATGTTGVEMTWQEDAARFDRDAFLGRNWYADLQAALHRPERDRRGSDGRPDDWQLPREMTAMRKTAAPVRVRREPRRGRGGARPDGAAALRSVGDAGRAHPAGRAGAVPRPAAGRRHPAGRAGSVRRPAAAPRAGTGDAAATSGAAAATPASRRQHDRQSEGVRPPGNADQHAAGPEPRARRPCPPGAGRERARREAIAAGAQPAAPRPAAALATGGD